MLIHRVSARPRHRRKVVLAYSTCSIFIWLLFLNGVAWSQEKTADWPITDKQVLLERLRAKDATIDNMAITYAQYKFIPRDLKEEHADRVFNAMKWGGGGVEVPGPPMNAEPYEAEHISKTTLILRGQEATFDRSCQFDHLGNHYDEPMRSIWTNVGGTCRKLHISARGSKILQDDHEPSGPTHFHSIFRRNAELALGVGYGKCPKSIDSITVDGEHVTCNATMSLWQVDTTTAELVLDRHLLVRSARLSVGFPAAGARKCEISTATEGVSNEDGTPSLATSGQFIHTEVVVSERNGEPKRIDFCEPDFRILLLGLKPNLTDQEYNDLVKLDLTDATDLFGKPIQDVSKPFQDVN